MKRERKERPPADRGSHADPRDYNFIEIKTQVIKIKDNIKLIIQFSLDILSSEGRC